MSYDSLIANPTVIAELQSVFGGGGGGGITSLSNTDGNVAVSVVGAVGKVNLEPTINVTTQLNAPTLKSATQLICSGEFLAGTSEGTLGQVLTSQGTGSNPKWETLALGSGMKFIGYQAGQNTTQPSNTVIDVYSEALTGLTIGKTFYVNATFSLKYEVIGNASFVLVVDGVDSSSIQYSSAIADQRIISFVFPHTSTLADHTIKIEARSSGISTANTDYYSSFVIEGQ